MSDFDRNIAAARTGYRTTQVAIDAGLRAHMIRVYNYMGAGVALTGLVAWFAYQAAGGDQIQIIGRQVSGLTSFGHAIFASPLMWVFVLAPLALVMVLSLLTRWERVRLDPAIRSPFTNSDATTQPYKDSSPAGSPG